MRDSKGRFIKGHSYWDHPNVRDSWIKKGKSLSIDTEFKVGFKPWNSGIKTGLIPWNKGIKMSEETRNKISEKLKGRFTPWNYRRLSDDTKRRISESKKGVLSSKLGKKFPNLGGINHYNWKGGITSENRKQRMPFRNTMQKLIFERDKYTCVICNKIGGALSVDHIKSWSKYPELRFDVGNCRTLCMACHYKVSFNKNIPNGLIWGHNLNLVERNINVCN